MTQPRWQPWVAVPPRLISSSAWASPLSLAPPAKTAGLEVVGRVAAGLVEDVGQDVGAVGRQPLAGDRVLAQPLDELAVGVAVGVRILGRAVLAAGVVEDDRLDLFRAHHRADAAAAAVAGGAQLRVGAGDGGAQQQPLAGRADRHVGDLVAVLAAQFFDQGIVVEQLQAVVDLDLHPVLVDDDLVEVVPFGLPFQDDRGVADPGQHLGGLAAGVGFLDGAGQRALAADREAPGHGAGAAAEHPRGDHQLVLRAEGMAEGVDLLADDQRGRCPTAQAGIIAGGFRGNFGATLGAHVDSDDFVHLRTPLPFKKGPNLSFPPGRQGRFQPHPLAFRRRTSSRRQPGSEVTINT